MKNANNFVLVDEEGKKVKCDVLFTFENEETQKHYMVYTDNTFDKDGNVNVYASIYDPESAYSRLMPVETEKEWKVIETILEEIQNNVRGAE